MTLILTAANDDIAVQVADTRLTDEKGRVRADAAVKSVIVRCTNATACLSYTGTACLERRRVDEWVAQTLNTRGSPPMTIDSVLTLLKDELNAALKRGSDRAMSKWGLELVLAGIGIKDNGLRSSIIVEFTNTSAPVPRTGSFQRFDPKGRPFERFLMTGDYRHYVGMSGSVNAGAALNSHRKQIEKLLEAREAVRLMDHLAAVIRELRKGGRFEKVIGPHCIGTAIRYDQALASKHYAEAQATKFSPIIVDLRGK